MRFVVLLVLLVLQFNVAYSNIGPKPSPSCGNIVGSSPMRNIKVLHEKLVIDFREVSREEGFLYYEGLVRVDASYKIRCLTNVKHLDLVFVANNLTDSRYSVKVDGTLQKGTLAPLDSIPSSWLPPDSIKWKSRSIPYLYTAQGLISFSINSLSKGEHLLEVSYHAYSSSWFRDNDVGICKSLVYILKPYNEWNNFGSVDIKILVPKYWSMYSNVELPKEDDGYYHRAFSALPSDYLSIVIKKPVFLAKGTSYLFILASSLLLLFIPYRWLKYRIEKELKQNKSKSIHLAHSFFISVVISILVYVIYFYNIELLRLMMGNQLNPTIGYGSGYLVFAYPLVLLLCIIVVLVFDVVYSTKLKKATANK